MGAKIIVNVLRLLTFGGVGLEYDDRPAAPQLRPLRLALLSVLAAAGDRGFSRERLAALFWPDSDEPHARHSLRQALYALRADLGAEVLRSTHATLSLDPRAITADVSEFVAALAAGDRERAVVLARGQFLDGFYLPNAPDFERWVEEERARLTAASTHALLELAQDATRLQRHDAAVEWWRRLTTADPLSGRFALGYLKALASRGDRAQALAFARQHQAVIQRELEADADPDVRHFEAELRATSLATGRPPNGLAAPQAAYVPERPVSAATLEAPARRVAAIRPSGMHRRALVLIGGLVAVTAVAASAARRGWWSRVSEAPTFAVGMIREEGIPDSLRFGGVITDMLATNLARIEGLTVLANSRLLAVVKPGADSSVGYAAAARRAGATELLEGRLLATSPSVLALDLRRVDLRSGTVKSAYRVSAINHYALVDSVTQVFARQFQLRSPKSSVADATTPSRVAYRLYAEGLRAYYQSDPETARRLMHAALEEDSTFAMAAYYEALLATSSQRSPGGRHITDVRSRALRLALQAPDRERLTITADLLGEDQEPRALAVAESLTTRYADDPAAFFTLGKVRATWGDWPGAVAATERAIALDSASETVARADCRLCQDFRQLADIYLWWDSLGAAGRAARRALRARPAATDPLFVLAQTAARLGDSAAAYAHFRRLLSLGGIDRTHKLQLDLLLEAYDVFERDVQQLLASSRLSEWSSGAWFYSIALRNQGRLREAFQFIHTGHLPHLPLPPVAVSPDDFNSGILAFERGDARAAARVFGQRVRMDMSRWSPGFQARHRAWNGTLQGMALAAAGDTLGVRALADSVEVWGRGSLFGRDRRAHHYLRGLVLSAAGRHEDAVRQYRAAIHSPTLGFTRVNYELARGLLRLGRPLEAIAALQPALRGEIDAANLYITRTDLHELLAQAFDLARQPDSATTHYRAVVRAWRRADPVFHARRDRAQAWLVRLAQRGARRSFRANVWYMVGNVSFRPE